ncbi:MAG: hydrogenase maturation nickel metallochaperone HypA [Clostridiales bacterium]|jgi:hydrogenase nickel incorporation protein HypA/HybF|nr:hydrogenase maturation nickel metallochaperone HypA [Clostridiales bacterium]
MHELGIVMEIVRVVEDLAKEQDITEVDTIVLQIGELSPVVPKYIEECYPAAIDGTFMEKTKLEIEIIPGNAMCKNCGTVFNLLSRNGICPKCQKKEYEILSGKDFFIKEIRVPGE